MNRKIYESKIFDGIELNDYWELGKCPLYIHVDKKLSLYVDLRELPTFGYHKIDSLQSLAIYLRKNSWTVESRYNNTLLRAIQNKISIHNTL